MMVPMVRPVPRQALVTGLLTLVLLVTAGCTGEQAAAPEGNESGSPSSSAAASSPTATPATPSPSSPSAATTPAASPPHPVSVPALFDRTYNGGNLRLRDEIATTDEYTSYSVTYRSGDLRVSGKLDVPQGRGPFPALVLAHGYIDPDIYVNGQGMRREQDWLARAGYVVLHTDYRNHGFSSEDPRAERRLRLDYAADVVNAVHALRRTKDVPVDDERIGLVGRSMGGGVIYNALVAQPGLVDAAVVFAPVSSRTADNFNHFIRDDSGDSALTQEILDAYGSPEQNPRFWRQASSRPYFSRITEPVLIHHGTADESCPLRWSRTTFRALENAGVDATMFVYEGEPHAFVADWPMSMRRTTAFLRDNLT
jgi:uncharacterized protein